MARPSLLPLLLLLSLLPASTRAHDEQPQPDAPQELPRPDAPHEEPWSEGPPDADTDAAHTDGDADDAPTTPHVHVHIDWQGHPAMHMPWSFFRPGLTDRSPRLRWRHQFRQVVYTPYLDRSGVRLFLAAAMAAERAENPRQARRLILRQLAYVERFVEENSDRYALARTPAEARRLLAETDKMVLVHSIEGGHLLLEEETDAAFWAEQGVALMTVMHLRDDELGGGALLPSGLAPLINPRGARRRRRGERRGLTERGRAALVELDEAGILVDLSHMTGASVEDALAVTAEHGIAPVVTHGKLDSIRSTDMAFRPEHIVEIYRQGGIFAIGISGDRLTPIEPSIPIPDDICQGSLESFSFHYRTVQALVEARAQDILGHAPTSPQDHTRLSLGWSSDWNGWVHHSRPAYGPEGCRDASELADPLAIDIQGLAHPGLLPSHWERLSRDGLDLTPMLRSSERFLQLWERARGERQEP